MKIALNSSIRQNIITKEETQDLTSVFFNKILKRNAITVTNVATDLGMTQTLPYVWARTSKAILSKKGKISLIPVSTLIDLANMYDVSLDDTFLSFAAIQTGDRKRGRYTIGEAFSNVFLELNENEFKQAMFFAQALVYFRKDRSNLSDTKLNSKLNDISCTIDLYGKYHQSISTMKANRQKTFDKTHRYSDNEFQGLSSAFMLRIKEAGNSIADIANITGKSRAIIYKWAYNLKEIEEKDGNLSTIGLSSVISLAQEYSLSLDEIFLNCSAIDCKNLIMAKQNFLDAVIDMLIALTPEEMEELMKFVKTLQLLKITIEKTDEKYTNKSTGELTKQYSVWETDINLAKAKYYENEEFLHQT